MQRRSLVLYPLGFVVAACAPLPQRELVRPSGPDYTWADFDREIKRFTSGEVMRAYDSMNQLLSFVSFDIQYKPSTFHISRIRFSVSPSDGGSPEAMKDYPHVAVQAKGLREGKRFSLAVRVASQDDKYEFGSAFVPNIDPTRRQELDGKWNFDLGDQNISIPLKYNFPEAAIRQDPNYLVFWIYISVDGVNAKPGAGNSLTLFNNLLRH